MCRLSVRQFVWKYWTDYWFVCGGCRIQFYRLSIVKHCCISYCTLCYVLSLTSIFVRAYMTQQHDTDYKYWYSGTGTGTWDSSTGTCTGTWMTEYWLQLWLKVTWRRFDQSAKQLVVGQTTIQSVHVHAHIVCEYFLCTVGLLWSKQWLRDISALSKVGYMGKYCLSFRRIMPKNLSASDLRARHVPPHFQIASAASGPRPKKLGASLAQGCVWASQSQPGSDIEQRQLVCKDDDIHKTGNT